MSAMRVRTAAAALVRLGHLGLVSPSASPSAGQPCTIAYLIITDHHHPLSHLIRDKSRKPMHSGFSAIQQAC